jgi:AraC-like DNA-binding protein
MKWITRERPKIDRIACPWLIKKYIDADAQFIFVPEDKVIEEAKRIKATPFDIPGVEHTHYGDHCTFDFFVLKYKIKDPAIPVIARIVRGADTDRFDIALQSSGLWAISAGLAYNFTNDHQLLEKGFMIYDALHSWATHLQQEKHSWTEVDGLKLQLFNTFVKPTEGSPKKNPAWVRQLKAIIQDQIDTNFNLSLTDVSKSIQVHPAYVSREFSKYFDNLSFGEYIRKMRIDKAIQLLETRSYTLAQIAYLTGFSDQSHFTRIFREQTGMQPSVYRKIVVAAPIKSGGKKKK